jgi:transposase
MAVRKRRARRTIRCIPDELWELVKPAIPAKEFTATGGRPRKDPRLILDGVLYVLRTGCQWKDLPAEYGSGSTCHRRFQEWVEAGVWRRMLRRLLREYDELRGLDWRWQSADTSLHKAPLAGEKNGPKPNRPRQVRYQAARAYRGRRGAGGASGERGQRA